MSKNSECTRLDERESRSSRIQGSLLRGRKSVTPAHAACGNVTYHFKQVRISAFEELSCREHKRYTCGRGLVGLEAERRTNVD